MGFSSLTWVNYIKCFHFICIILISILTWDEVISEVNWGCLRWVKAFWLYKITFLNKQIDFNVCPFMGNSSHYLLINLKRKRKKLWDHFKSLWVTRVQDGCLSTIKSTHFRGHQRLLEVKWSIQHNGN